MKKTELVYFFRQNGTNHVKIGFTSKPDVSSRFSSFCTYAPYGGKIIGVIKTESGIKTERQIHSELAHRRLKGEFFNISEDECEKIIYRYNSDEINCIVSNFNIWLSTNKANLENLNQLFKNSVKVKPNEVIHDDINKLILKYFNTENRNSYMTATEMKDYIISNETDTKINSMKIFGSCLVGIFGKSKSKNYKGVIKNRYYIGINI